MATKSEHSAKSFSEHDGKIHIYTGNGKGKTSAATGLAIRAAGRGLKVYIGKFMKGRSSGEDIMLQGLNNIEVEKYGKKSLQKTEKADKEQAILAHEGLKKLKEKMHNKSYDIIVADEIFLPLHFGALNLTDILELIEQKPNRIELVMTGRKAPEEAIREADLVTTMEKTKHYWDDGIGARLGIEK